MRFFLQKSLDFYTWFSMYSKNLEGWLNVCTSSQIWLSLPIDDNHLSYKQCAPLVGTLITHWIAKNKANVNEIWWFEGRGVKSPKLKSLEHTIAYGWQLFHPCTNNIQCMKVCNLLFFSSQMKSVQNFFLYNPWPRSSHKKGKKSNDHGHIQVQFKV
jgi:hypothetical protein